MNSKTGIELWKKAKKLIPGGTQLLSKRSEMFLPELWPSFYKKAKGVYVWDLDNNKFTDMSIMGVGACILGYADNDVDSAVKRTIDMGSMSTLNSPEDVELAELLLGLHKWASMVRYARTGGEAMAVAVRIARAHSGKDKLIFCGYHGWHDWYLSANLADDKALDGHLLSGLEPAGVPRALKGTAIPFRYNDADSLQQIFEKNNDIAAVVMEPVRHQEPAPGFLKQVRKIASENNAVLIFDEVTTGWRMRLGGVYEMHDTTPDIVVYAKAIGNGFPMAAIVGNEVMDAAQRTFISSTGWTERIGPAAAIATISKLRDCNVPEHLVRVGKRITKGWADIAKENGLKLSTMGIPPLAAFAFDYKNNQAVHTLFTQEMLERGFLASKQVYVSHCHKDEHVEKYLENADEAFRIIKKAIDSSTVEKKLKGPTAHKGFSRLN